MAASSLDLDLTGTNPANEFSAETRAVNTSTDRSVWPENYPFFINDGFFQIEGRVGEGPWFTLRESVDYIYSPQFSEFSVSTGREIVSYVVIMNDTITQVRYNYKSLGKYVDQTILNEIIALESAGKLDRSSVVSWLRIKGQSPNYALAEDPNVIGRTWEEILTLKMQEIKEALLNPSSSTAILPKDITAINLALSSKIGLEEAEAAVLKNSVSPYVATAGENAQVFPFPGNVTGFSAQVHITERTGVFINMFSIKVWRDAPAPGGTWQVSLDDEDVGLAVSERPVSIQVAPQGGDFVLVIRHTTAVTYQFKLTSLFESV